MKYTCTPLAPKHIPVEDLTDELTGYQGKWANLYVWPHKTSIGTARCDTEEAAKRGIEQRFAYYDMRYRTLGRKTNIYDANGVFNGVYQDDLITVFQIPVKS